MNKRQAKIEAYHLIFGILTSSDICMWDDGNIKDQTKILNIIHNVGNKYLSKAKRLSKFNSKDGK